MAFFDNMVVGLGYQYAQTNTGCGTGLSEHNDIPTDPSKAQGCFECSVYKTHELIASTSYSFKTTRSIYKAEFGEELPSFLIES